MVTLKAPIGVGSAGPLASGRSYVVVGHIHAHDGDVEELLRLGFVDPAAVAIEDTDAAPVAETVADPAPAVVETPAAAVQAEPEAPPAPVVAEPPAEAPAAVEVAAAAPVVAPEPAQVETPATAPPAI